MKDLDSQSPEEIVLPLLTELQGQTGVGCGYRRSYVVVNNHGIVHPLLILLPFHHFSVIESGKINHTVQVGIEKIRAVGQAHGLQVQLLCYLGNTFGSKVIIHFLK